MCRKLFAGFLYLILFLPLAIVTIFVASISSWILDRGFYLNLLDNNALYEAILSEELPRNLEITTAGTSLENVPAEAMIAGMKEVLTPEYMRGQVVGLVNGFFDLIDGKTTTLNLAIDLRPIKAGLSDTDRGAFAAAFAAALPACTAAQSATAETLPICRPSDKSVDQLASEISEALPKFVNSLPDTVSLSDEANAQIAPEDLAFLTNGGVRGVLNAGMAWIFGPLVITWLIIAFMGGTWLRGTLLWLGWMLIFPAALVLTSGMGLRNVIGEGLQSAISNISNLGSSTEAALSLVAANAGNRVADGFVTYGGGALVVGVVLVILGFVLRPRPEIQDGMYINDPLKPKRG